MSKQQSGGRGRGGTLRLFWLQQSQDMGGFRIAPNPGSHSRLPTAPRTARPSLVCLQPGLPRSLIAGRGAQEDGPTCPGTKDPRWQGPRQGRAPPGPSCLGYTGGAWGPAAQDSPRTDLAGGGARAPLSSGLFWEPESAANRGKGFLPCLSRQQLETSGNTAPQAILPDGTNEEGVLREALGPSWSNDVPRVCRGGTQGPGQGAPT